MHISEKMFQCLLTFTYIWSQELGKGPENHRDGIPASFARTFFTKFNDLYVILWESKERLSQNVLFDMLGRTACDLVYIHSCL